jgi:hypothetical protein
MTVTDLVPFREAAGARPKPALNSDVLHHDVALGYLERAGAGAAAESFAICANCFWASSTSAG